MNKESQDEILSVFVYGTLKKGQLRGDLWPKKPLEIISGLLQADLYDLGPYPAITLGENWVSGEIWSFSSTDITETLQVLDRVEGYHPTSVHNEYIRRAVRVQLADEPEINRCVECWTYFCASESRLIGKRKIEPWYDAGKRRVALWPDSQSRVPRSFEEE